MAVSQNIIESQEYIQSFQLLNFQSKDELSLKIGRMEELLLTEIRKKNNDYKKIVVAFHSKLAVYVNNLKTVDKDVDVEEEMVIEVPQSEDNLFADCRDRTNLKNVSYSMVILKTLTFNSRNCGNCQKKTNI